MKRNIYLKKKSLEEARSLLAERFPGTGVLEAETVPATEAVGRVLSEALYARISSPNFNAAAMDGIAVKAADTFGAAETRPRELAGGKNAFFVNTGHVLPEGTDAVIMIEDVQVLDDERLRIEAPAFPWQNVRRMGEDIVATELLFPRNHVFSPYCVGALISGGVYQVPVRRRPRVLIIPTGSELVDHTTAPPEKLKAGQVVESNSHVLLHLAEAAGAVGIRRERVVDDPDTLRSAIDQAADQDVDIVLTVGGSSAGSEDFTRGAVETLGEVLVHGVTIMPGKPVLAGVVRGKPIFGIPGYPVSAIVAFEQFVRPLICRMLGKPDEERARIPVEPTRKIPSRLGVEEFLRVKLGRVGERIVATPLPRGAGSITTITEADGIIRIPSHIEGIAEGETAEAELIRPLSGIENTIVVVGSHDNTLDLITDELRARKDHLVLSSSHVGSMGGLMAIRRGACHLAGAHLLDEESGTYNVTYIRRYLPGIGVRLVNLVLRDQGLIVAPGNPKAIRGIGDLARPDVTFINRQAGSGTRILLDYRLRQLGIDPAAIRGYETDEYTHMAVAVAVLGGAADAGLGIHAAARALGLDFIPVVTEQYDLVIPEVHFNTDKIQALMEVVRSDAFQKRVKALGGYSTEKTGTLIE
ncbi:MAG: molybdopterin biosynthesis protein [Desulfobacterales bacterium]|jgi:putative molybdopterin biosynthesis protein